MPESAESLRKRLKNKYVSISTYDLMKMISKDSEKGNKVLYFKIVYDSKMSVSIRESLPISKTIDNTINLAPL
jgi:hypothetical protein